MKKYTLFLFVFIFALFNININHANSVILANDSCLAGVSRTLRAGSAGDDVRCLQQALKITIDGKFGPKTKITVKAWQASRGLAADGVFGAKSRAYWIANDGTISQTPIISGISGPQTLNINQLGTWIVTAFNPNGGNLSYSVFWGDEFYPGAGMHGPVGQPAQPSATFTHSYAQPGIYTPKFKVTNSNGKSVEASLSVNVGEIVTPNQVPTISSLSSTSSAAGSSVTIYGSNFTATGNKIKFGDSNSENDPSYNLSSNGNSIAFTVPSTYYVACLNSVPRCDIATRMILPGVYDVSVINANGTSNAMKFTMTPTYTQY